MTARLLLSEGSSLTSREFVTVLGRDGHRVEILDPNPWCLCRFSRWVDRVHSVPPVDTDPEGYLAALSRLWETGRFDAVIPTHEQAWLFSAAGREFCERHLIAVAHISAFDRLQSKLEFARLLDELGLPQPPWRAITDASQLAQLDGPHFLKAPFSNAGSGVRRVTTAEQAMRDFGALGGARDHPLMLQLPAEGRYAQVQAVFDGGRLVASHTSALTATGVGGSAAGRESVDHPSAREDVRRLGEHLGWHGGLTLDYLFDGDAYAYLECNPRTTEPANAAASGVDLPALHVALSRGEHPAAARPPRAGTRTHGALAILLGAAIEGADRCELARLMLRLLAGRSPLPHSREALTPVRWDALSLIPLLIVSARLLVRPASAAAISAASIRSYSVPPSAVARVRR